MFIIPLQSLHEFFLGGISCVSPQPLHDQKIDLNYCYLPFSFAVFSALIASNGYTSGTSLSILVFDGASGENVLLDLYPFVFAFRRNEMAKWLCLYMALSYRQAGRRIVHRALSLGLACPRPEETREAYGDAKVVWLAARKRPFRDATASRYGTGLADRLAYGDAVSRIRWKERSCSGSDIRFPFRLDGEHMSEP